MKKVIAVLLSFCLLFALASCGGGSSSGDTVKEDSSPAETAASTPEPAASSDDSPPPDSGAADEGKEDEEEEGYPKYTGEIIVSILGDPDGDHSNFQYLTEAYKKYQPDVTFSFEPLKTDSYVPWLATQLASGHIRPDIVSGNYAATYQGYVNLNLYRNRVNHYTGRTWQEELNFDLISETNAKGEKYMLPSEAVHIYGSFHL